MSDDIERELQESADRIVAANLYGVLATADADGRPWATPVFFTPDGDAGLLWVSNPESRHSRNIAVRTQVAVTVFDSHAPVGGAEAVYLDTEAGVVPGSEVQAALAVFNARLPPQQHLSTDDVAAGAPFRLYRAAIRTRDVLIRGGDPRFENVTDARRRVDPRPHR